MKHNALIISVPLLFAFAVSCTTSSDSGFGFGPGGGNSDGGTGGNPDWLVPTKEVFDGGPGKDGIRALETGTFEVIPASQENFLESGDLVIGVVINGSPRAYPDMIMEHHEIANDRINGEPFSLTFCPLTGTAIGWGRTLDGTVTTFGVSGLLYKNNLMPYDRKTDSIWSQMGNQSVNGPESGTQAENFPVVETTWETWKTMYPGTDVLSLNTGYIRNYGPPLYGNYNQNNSRVLFPIGTDDSRLPRKTRVLGVIINGAAKVYTFDAFPEEIGIIEDSFAGTDILVAGSRVTYKFMVAFEKPADATFEPVQNELPVIMIDDEGTKWDVFGNGVSGPGAGQQLTAPHNYIGFWFAFGDFFPGLPIYGTD